MIQKSLHHSFDVDLAAVYGTEEAVLIHHFQHWISVNARLKKNYHDGTYWTYQTIDEIAAHFKYIPKERIVNHIERLCTGKSRFSKKEEKEFEPVLKKGNFNKSRYDRTVWYAFCDHTKWILCEHKIENGEPQNEDCGNTTPIPNTINTYTKTNYTPNGVIVAGGSENHPTTPALQISFNFEKESFENIEEKHFASWKEAYPAVDVKGELLKMTEWIMSNQSKAKSKKNWRGFITKWLTRTNEKAIDSKSRLNHPPTYPAAPPSVDRRQKDYKPVREDLF